MEGDLHKHWALAWSLADLIFDAFHADPHREPLVR
jgi:hypothetical protein